MSLKATDATSRRHSQVEKRDSFCDSLDEERRQDDIRIHEDCGELYDKDNRDNHGYLNAEWELDHHLATVPHCGDAASKRIPEAGQEIATGM